MAAKAQGERTMKGAVRDAVAVEENNAKVLAGRNGRITTTDGSAITTKDFLERVKKAVAPKGGKKKPQRKVPLAEAALNALPSYHMDQVKAALARRKGQGVYG